MKFRFAFLTICLILVSSPALAGRSIHQAAYYGEKDVVNQVLEHQDLIHCLDSYGRVPLHFAALGGRTELVKFLLDKGSDPNAVEKLDGMTPLHCAVLSGKPELVSLLLQAGADTDLKDLDNNTPLSLAEKMGNKKVIKVLQKAGGGEE